jgi:hypothetical protein
MIRRGKHKTNFVVLPNSILEDGRLSAASKGTLAYLLSRPPGWEVRHDASRRTMKLGRKSAGSHGQPIERLPKDCAGQAVRELISESRPRRNFKAAGEKAS